MLKLSIDLNQRDIVIISEVFSELQELVGEICVKQLQENFPAIARALLSEVQD